MSRQAHGQTQLAKPDKPVEAPTRRVLIADDSATMRYYLANMLSEQGDMTVIGQSRDGEEAIRMTARLQPDVVSMDIRMPGIDGLEATRRIMANTPTPVVVVSSLVERDMQLSMQALEAGALAVVEKPPSRRDPTFEAKQSHLIRTLLAMSSVSVVRRGGYPLRIPPQGEVTTRASTDRPEIICIGASAGGPSAISKILPALPPNFPLPILIVQHIPHEFVSGLARWLDGLTLLPVKVAEDGVPLHPGVVHLSPGNAHVKIIRAGRGLMTRLILEQGDRVYQPSIDLMFESAAAASGGRAVGVILTGMGDDGASGMLALHRAGGYTLAQDQDSATVFGMPGACIMRGAVQSVVSLADLPAALMQFV